MVLMLFESCTHTLHGIVMKGDQPFLQIKMLNKLYLAAIMFPHVYRLTLMGYHKNIMCYHDVIWQKRQV